MSMWDAFKNLSAEDEMVAGAIAATEREIFSDALDLDDDHGLDDSFYNSEDIAGNEITDDEGLYEAMGGEPEEEDPGRQYREPAPRHDQMPDPFADPQGHSEWLLRQAAHGHLPGLDYRTNTLGEKPDQFADPAGHDAWMLNAMAHMAGVHERAEAQFNMSFQNAEEQHGDTFREAWNALGSLPVQTRRAAISELTGVSQRGGDPGQHLVSQFVQARAAAEHARAHGRPYNAALFKTLPVNHAARSRGLGYEPPTSREGAEEEDIFNSVWD